MQVLANSRQVMHDGSIESTQAFAVGHPAKLENLRRADGASREYHLRRYVRDGNLVTAAGVSAGIDMALWLVGQLYDPVFARKVQHQMEYNPAPPYSAEV